MEFNLDNKIATRVRKEIYKDGEYAIKLFEENYSKADILNEALNQARVEEGTDIKMPKLVAVTQINNRWAIVSDFISGTPLSVLMSENPEKEEEYLELFVKLQLEVLSKKVPLLNRIKEKFRRKITEATNIEEHTRYELLQRLEGMNSDSRLCHGDFTPSNIIISENGDAYIIDWSHVTRGNAEADAARTYLLFSMKNYKEHAEKYLEMFSKKSGISKDKLQRWIPIVAATQMTKEKPEEQEFLKNWIDVVDFE